MFYQQDYDKDFESPGKVSIWLAKFETEESLKSYMKPKNTEEDDTYSDFYLEFRMGYLDYDFIDYIMHKDPVKSLEELFCQVSYSESIVANLMAEPGIDPTKYNAVICVFDYDFTPDEDYVQKNEHVVYFGSVNYDRNSGKIKC